MSKRRREVPVGVHPNPHWQVATTSILGPGLAGRWNCPPETEAERKVRVARAEAHRLLDAYLEFFRTTPYPEENAQQMKWIVDKSTLRNAINRGIDDAAVEAAKEKA